MKTHRCSTRISTGVGLFPYEWNTTGVLSGDILVLLLIVYNIKKDTKNTKIMPQEVKARLWYKKKTTEKKINFTSGRNNNIQWCGYHRECKCKFRLKTDLTSLVNLKASNIGKRSSSAMS